LTRLPNFAGRVFSADNLDAPDMANHISVCDVLLQTYPDGITARRSSAIAALALGTPIVTAAGVRSEGIWHQSDVVFLSKDPSVSALIVAVEEALENEERRAVISVNAAEFYQRYFAVSRTIEQLQSFPT
jgi:glycosyltransferase involved in cell wall biosynthesis